MKRLVAHRYTSTACHHAQHERCRRTCKFCQEPCRCRCHPGQAAKSETWVEKRLRTDERFEPGG